MNPIISEYRTLLEKTALQSLEYKAKPWEMGIYAGHKGKSTHRGPATASGTGTAAAVGATAVAVPGLVAGGPPVLRAMTSKGRGKMISEGIHDVAHGTAGAEEIARSFIRGAGKSIADDAPKGVKDVASTASDSAKKVKDSYSEKGVSGAATAAKDEAKRVGSTVKEKARDAAKDTSSRGGRVSKELTEAFNERGLAGVRDYVRKQSASPSGNVSRLAKDLTEASGEVRERAIKSGAKEGIEAFKKSRLPQILARRAKGTGKAMLVGAGAAAGLKAIKNISTYETGRALATKDKKGNHMRKSASADLAPAYRNAATSTISNIGLNEHLVKIACADELEKMALVPLARAGHAVGRGLSAIGLKGAGGVVQRDAARWLNAKAFKAATKSMNAGRSGNAAARELYRKQGLRFAEEGLEMNRGAQKSFAEGLKGHIQDPSIITPWSEMRSGRLLKGSKETAEQSRELRKRVKRLSPQSTKPAAPAQPPPQAAAPANAVSGPAAPTNAVPGPAGAQPLPAGAAPQAGQQPSLFGWDQFPAQAAQGQAQIPLADRAAGWFRGLSNSQLRNNLLLGVGGVGAAGMGAGLVGSSLLGGGGQQTVVYR